MDFGSGGLAALQKLASLPRWPDHVSEADQLDLLREEAAIGDQFMVYAYAYDNSDLDAVLTFFTDDCVIRNPRGEVRGAKDLRDNYVLLFSYWKFQRHAWSNVIIRFLDTTPSEAYIGAYHNAILVSDERTLAGTGTDIRHLKKV